MKIAWVVLLISAITDFVINAGTSLMAAMVATGSAVMPAKAVVVLATVGGLVQMSRTIQQALKVTPDNAALLRGEPSPIVMHPAVIALADALHIAAKPLNEDGNDK